MMYEVAIIIPTLNEEKFISSCIDSVLNQSFPIDKMEILVVDGGSVDTTTDIVKEYSAKFANIRLLNNPQKIQSVAFNIGVDNSSAPYVIRMDAHAVYNEKYVELCVKELKNNPTFGNVGGVWNIVPQHNRIESEAIAIINQVKFGIGGAAFRVGVANAGFVDTVPFGAFPRKVIEELGGMREDLPRAEDNEYNSRIRKAGYKIYLNPEIVCTYYARDTIWASMKQMFANGKSIGNLLYVEKNAVGLRHLVPLFFVLGLFCPLIFAIFYKPLFWIFILVLSLYFFANICATFLACKKFGFKYIGILPVAFFLMHCSYGIGTICGLLKK